MCYLIPWLSRERSGNNFRARPLPIFVILSNWGTYAISRDSEMVNPLVRAHVHNFPDPPGERTSWNFCSRLLPILLISPNYGTCAISCDSMTESFLVRARTLADSRAHPEAHWLQFSRATTSNIRHFVQLGYLCDFAQSRDGQSFSTCALMRKVSSPPGSALVGIFWQFHTIPTWSIL